ncbi:unnamed protein product [Blepharisma stoltei]|uniref:ubiquitinyl hydrolase 1 n=1 Tax=Blepharisma stoltei TaxID=1481888 RepID=A0AAU9J4F2_9CILI|nr:unnamed protein product [Blepharisma stoltei]
MDPPIDKEILASVDNHDPYRMLQESLKYLEMVYNRSKEAPKSLYSENQIETKIEKLKQELSLFSSEAIGNKEWANLMLELSKSYRNINEIMTSKSILLEGIEKCQDSDILIELKKHLESLDEKMDGSEEYKEFQQIFKEQVLSEGSLWHLVSKLWFDAWSSYSRGDSVEHPGMISNGNLIENIDADKIILDPLPCKSYTNVFLKKGILEEIDYVILSKEAYSFLVKKYGHDNTEIKRWCISISQDASILQVEVHLKPIQIIWVSDSKKAKKVIQISRKETIKNLIEKLERIHRCPQNTASKLWKIDPNSKIDKLFQNGQSVVLKGAMLLNEREDLENCEIADEDLVLFESKSKNGLWKINLSHEDLCPSCQNPGNLLCTACRKVKYCSTACQRSHYKEHKEFCRHIKISETQSSTSNGLTGLQNLGNTCFMNSALQCIAHTLPLTNFFITNEFQRDINTNNPLGTKGAVLAYSYADLIKEMWTNSSSISPWSFKKTIAKFAPQFTGYQQHDSHELLSYLLTGLHEDLNRVKKKPYTEKPETDNKSDQEAAHEAWEWFLMRNQSIIVDLMYGQCKSTLTCPHCNRISITFDPFLSFSVSIPNFEAKEVTIYYAGMNSEPPLVKQTFMMNMNGTIGRLKELIKLSFNAAGVIICWYNKFTLKGVVNDDIEIGDISSQRILIAFETPESMENREVLPIYIRQNQKSMLSGPNRIPASFVRLVFPHHNDSLANIHLKVALAIKPLLQEKYNRRLDNISDIKDLSYEELYQLNIVNASKSADGYFTTSKLPCDFCGNPKCENCPLPFTEEESFIDILEKMKNYDGTLSLEVLFSHKIKDFQSINSFEDKENFQDPQLERKRKLTLYDCLDYSCRPEKLDAQNEWYCNKCQKQGQAVKLYQIYKLPQILILHLIRFRSRSYWTQKLSAPVEFPLEGLDLSNYVLGDKSGAVYDLYAVSNHYGGLGGGHYTAYVKDVKTGDWMDMDDSMVSKANSESVVSPAAYILFYKRR